MNDESGSPICNGEVVHNCFLDSRCECGLKSLYLRDISKIKL